MTASVELAPAAHKLERIEFGVHAPRNDGEFQVEAWLRELGITPEHERWFYPFWVDPLTGQPHGFRLDFTFVYDGIFMGVEVCEAGRHPIRPIVSARWQRRGKGATKWKPPARKFQDKRDKIAKLYKQYRVPCALVTDAEIDLWQAMDPGERQAAIRLHLALAYQNLALRRVS